MRKLLSILLTLVMVAGIGVCGSVGARAVSIPAGYIPIYTAKDLDNIRYNETGKFILMNDIDMDNWDGEGHSWGLWYPIGQYKDEGEWSGFFSGVLDGNGHVIKNLKIRAGDAALFAYVDGAEIKNLGLVDNDIVGTSCAAGFCATSYGKSVFYNCYNAGKVSGGSTAGGIVADAAHYVGGSEEVLAIRNCYNTGSVEATASGSKDYPGIRAYAGGIMASSRLNKRYDISRCYNSGTVSASIVKVYNDYHEDGYTKSQAVNGAYAGGIVGWNQMATVVNCYNTGTVRGKATGTHPSASEMSTPTAETGGIAGMSVKGSGSYGLIAGCYNVGTVEDLGSEIKRVGSIAGSLHWNGYDLPAGYDYYLERGLPAFGVLGQAQGKTPKCPYVESATAAQLKQKDTYKGFDFDNVWQINEGVSYPTLRLDTTGALEDPLPKYEDNSSVWDEMPTWLYWILRIFFFGWLWMS